jgi:hypothetical protein
MQANTTDVLAAAHEWLAKDRRSDFRSLADRIASLGRGDRKKAMAKAYKRLRRQRTERRLENQRFMEPSKRPLMGKRKKSFIRSLFSKGAHKH